MFGGTQPLKITKPIRLIELFGGIGCQAQALTNLCAEFEHYRLCEFDKYALASYNAIHGTSFKKSDIRKWRGYDLGICETDKFEYIMTYSFPCQDLSLAGKQLGLTKGSGTRSGLLWEVERLLNGCQELPQILLMENVPQVHSLNNMEDFRMWLEFLESKGYKNYYQDLNATSYGVAQNRNRCFMVSCLGDCYYDFPQGFKLEKRLKDYLETKVDKKYYLSQKQIENFKTSTYAQNKDTKCVVVGDLHIPGWLESACRVHSVDGVAPACNTCGGGGLETKILEPTIIEDFYANREPREYADICPTLRSDRSGLKVKEPLVYDEQNKRLRMDGTVGTLTTDGSTPKYNNRVILPCYDLYLKAHNIGVLFINGEYFFVRKLTPKECWRLMGWQDEQLEKAQAVNSNSQLYKQAGNGIVIQVLEQIFKELL